MASSRVSIPRFLLPQSGQIWRRAGGPTLASSVSSASGPVSASASAAASPRILARLASSKSPGKDSSSARVLAKPERFNPPSHGSRLPKKTPPRHYGGDLTADEAVAQTRREYPGMPPPKASRAHWFLHSRWIHVVITVGTLSGLAIWTFALSFRQTSPFADMLPPAADYLRHPVTSVRTLIEVLRLHEAHKTARISDKRRRNVEDVAKRAAYRKAHGLPDEMGLFNLPMAKIQVDEVQEQQAGAEQVEETVREYHQADGGERQEGGEVGAAAPAAAETGAAKEAGHEEARRLTEEERQAAVKQAKGKWLGIF